MLRALTNAGYEMKEVLHQGANTIVYRGRSQANGNAVIIKVLKAEYPTIEQITRLKHEYRITENLDLVGVVKVDRLIASQNRLALILEDFGGESLKQWLSSRTCNLVSFLSIATQLAQALRSLHQHQIIHKDIKPANIIINPHTGQVKLTDFSIASCLSKETPQLTNPNQLEGTLAYMSPEQTGRMNRSLDYRTDFYSLGVTFYEMLTGQLPFQSNDPLELIHAHIARQPDRFKIINSKLNNEQLVPEVIADIVIKLMGKNAEDRYQSAAGLLADLETCLDRVKITGAIADFIPGRLDILSQLLIPQKLYGREAQVNQLLDAFDRVSQGTSELMLVSGYSGIGKSSVVNEVNKPITKQRGYFISGKFDQFKSNIPYASLIQAFGLLMRQLLTESPAELAVWKAKFLEAVGTNGQVIIDVIPEVELIIGKQPNLPEFAPTESQSRFHQVFQKFIRVFARKEHPLVIFLDDLQWADSATLQLIKLLISNPQNQYLLLVGAYRDNEVSPIHPLRQTIEEIEKFGIKISNIILRSLGLNDVIQLVSEALNDPDRTNLLAELIWNKTGGNPFFVVQLLQAIYQDGLLKFSFEDRLWQWSIDEIRAIGITDKNIVELLASRIEKLPKSTQKVLQLAACVGDRFTLDVLAIVNEKSASATASDLYNALQAGLILPLSEAYRIPLVFDGEEASDRGFDPARVGYKFLHDRVQQAAYSLIPESEKKATHLQIGELLLQHASTEEIESNIFNIVNQFNLGIDLVIQPSQKDELARLNLIAGRKAKASNAYEPALKYLNAGINLLSAASWQTDYELTLKFYESAAEVAYLNSEFELMSQRAEILLQQAQNLRDRINIYEIKIRSLNAQNRFQEALEISLEVLNLLGFYLPLNPTEADIDRALTETADLVSKQGIDTIVNLPNMTDENALAALQILRTSTVSVYFINFPLYLLVISLQVKLSVRYGNTAISAFAYMCYGVILCVRFEDIDRGYQFGKLALELLPKFDDPSIQTKVLISIGCTIWFWKHHLRESLPFFKSAYHSGFQSGDLEYAAWCYFSENVFLYWTGEELKSLESRIENYSHAIRQLKQELALEQNEMLRQVVLNLLGNSEHPWDLIGTVYNEQQSLPQYQATNNLYALHHLHLYKLVLNYLFGRYRQALENATLATDYATAATGRINLPLLYFYESLARLAIYPNLTQTEREQVLKQVAASQKKMQHWATHAPMNFQHKYDLVEAEKCRVLGQITQAMDAYDRAIEGATENGYIQEKALGNELAAQFYLSIRKDKIAKAYITEAYYDYLHWGAIAKVQDLDKRYPNLIVRSYIATPATSNLTETFVAGATSLASSSSSNSKLIDLATVMKAAEAIASEIVLDNLLHKLLYIILENAAAQKGCLILEKDGQLFIEVADTYQNETVAALRSTPVENSADIPLSVINYVTRTLEPVVLADASQETIYRSDAYILRHQPKSVLCTPIIYQGKFLGLFYLENNLTTGAFRRQHLELLKLLTTQAAIAIENARLYAGEQEKSYQLTQFLQQLQQTQLQLVQSEKMSALGNLVAGVAHEINNPAGFIIGNLAPVHNYLQDLFGLIDLYREKFPDPGAEITAEIENIELEFLREDLPKLVVSMKEGIERICHISNSLRTFSRADKDYKVPFNIHEGIESTLLILKHRLKANENRPAIEVVKDYGTLPLVKCFAGQLNQVFMNLLANAIDALEESNQGRSLADIKAKPNRIEIQTNLAEDGQHVHIWIRDNGVGMDEGVKQKVFDHLFTTKPVGQGTGLGLAIAYQIVVEKHQGSLTVNSALGEGSEFAIALPIAELPPKNCTFAHF